MAVPLARLACIGLTCRERLDNNGGVGKGSCLDWVVWLVIAIALMGVLFGR